MALRATAAAAGPPPVDVQLHEVFYSYAAHGALDGVHWAKLCRDSGVSRDGTEIDICFARACPKGRRKLGLVGFESALADVAQRTATPLEEVHRRVLAVGGGPALRGTRPASDAALRRMTDTARYTGAHRERFDADGRGRGLAGRDSVSKGAGCLHGAAPPPPGAVSRGPADVRGVPLPRARSPGPASGRASGRASPRGASASPARARPLSPGRASPHRRSRGALDVGAASAGAAGADAGVTAAGTADGMDATCFAARAAVGASAAAVAAAEGGSAPPRRKSWGAEVWRPPSPTEAAPPADARAAASAAAAAAATPVAVEAADAEPSGLGERLVGAFYSYAAHGALDGFHWAKLCRDSGVSRDGTEIDICFARACPKGRRKLGLVGFESALADVAQRTATPLEEVHRRVLAVGGGPALRGTRPASDAALRRMTDTARYTGAHRERFDADGRGRGLAGRDSVSKGAGCVRGAPADAVVSRGPADVRGVPMGAAG